MSIGIAGQFGYRVLGRGCARPETGVSGMVGALIRSRRLAKGWSQEVLAAKMGKAQRQITRWEGYTTQIPRDATRIRLGELLGIAEAEWHLAAARGVGGGAPAIEKPPAPPDTPPHLPARDSERVPLAQMVADVEARRGEAFQARLRASRARLPRAAYESFCADLWRMWEGNSLMAFNLLDGRGGGD
jgi:transcriptional regulator with XRE-family HTH domain